MKLHKKTDPLFFLLLPVTVFLAVVLVPIVSSFYYSLMDWDGITGMRFIGLANYAKLFSDTALRTVLLNSLVYSIISTICQVGLGLLLAILVTNLKKGQNLVRMLLFTPTVISSMAMMQTFKKLLGINPDGVFNALLELVGLSNLKTAFLANMTITLPVVAIVDSLRYMGLYMVVFYAAFVAVDQEIIEAAYIDGATRRQTLVRVKLPMIRPVIVNCIVLVTIGTFKAFEGPFILTNGGPGYASELIATYMYKVSFSSMNYGYGSALSILIVVLCLGIFGLLNKIIRQKGGDGE